MKYTIHYQEADYDQEQGIVLAARDESRETTSDELEIDAAEVSEHVYLDSMSMGLRRLFTGREQSYPRLFSLLADAEKGVTY